MKRVFVLASAVLAWTVFGSGAASAAPGDSITVTGTVQQERSGTIVVRTDNGAMYLADLSRATARGDFRVGEPVRVVGHEGRRPGEIIAAFVEPVGRGARTSSADVLEVDGWLLPRSHVYQVQDDRGVYYQLPPRDIPAAILRGKEVYDLTARAWVNHPSAYATTQGRNPAYTVVAAPPVYAGVPAVGGGDVLLADGWRLPRSHYYQAQDDQGVYHPVQVRDVPSTILRGKEVYDVTAQAWVNHPTAFAATGGRNPAYTAAAAPLPGATDGDVVLIDGWRLPRAHIYQVQDDRGVYYQISPADAPGQIIRGKEVYDLTAQAWVNHPTAFAATGGKNPAFTATAEDYARDRGRGGRSEAPGAGWQELRGTVERVDRFGFTLRTDDGWSVAVDLRDAGGPRSLSPGERVVVVGASREGRFVARQIALER